MVSGAQPLGLIQRYRELMQARHDVAISSDAPPVSNGSCRFQCIPDHQALAALLFLDRDLLERELELEGVVRARTRQRVPVVLSEAEGEPALMVGMLYGSGLRLMEALRLRPESPSRPAAIPSDTLLPPICWSEGRTSALSRSSWGTRT